jgi:phenylacetate-CoA ligase
MERYNAVNELFILKQRLGRPRAYRRYQEWITQERLSRDELHTLQWIAKRDILRHAFDTVPFYRKRFAALGLHPDDIRTAEDWPLVPVLTRADIISAGDSLISSAVRRTRLRRVTTGGSSGVPVEVFHDREFPAETLSWRMLSWWGVPPGAHAAHAYRLTRSSALQRAGNFLLWWPTRRIWFDASQMTPSRVDRFMREYRRLRPALVLGYVGAVHHLARHISDRGLTVPAPTAVWVTAAPITAAARFEIAAAFGAPVYDQYGCSEIHSIAAQCARQEHLHIHADARAVEIISDENAAVEYGQVGRVVVTDLTNYVFPLLRYENGDRGQLASHSCECGNELPLMAPVQGRSSDVLWLSDGSAIAGEFLTTIFDDHPRAVRGFQVVQAPDLSITVRYVPSGSGDIIEQALAHVRQLLESRTQGTVAVRTEMVDEISSDRGKSRFVVSHAQRVSPVAVSDRA